MTVLALVASTIHFGQYLAQALFHAGESPWIPRSQKLVLAIDLAWITAIASWGAGRWGGSSRSVTSGAHAAG